jgi:hypothetical protein
MIEYGIFDDQAKDHTQEEALDYGFVTRADAQRALELEADLYGPHAQVHEIEFEDPDADDIAYMRAQERWNEQGRGGL